MITYARIENNKVQEIFQTNLDIYSVFPTSWTWVDVSKVSPQPCVGWDYVNGVFSEGVMYPHKNLSNADIETLRLQAYANPLTGSDRYFSEAGALQAEGFTATSTEVKEAKAKGLARKLEIKALYPKLEV